jgi:hypothetical protein
MPRAGGRLLALLVQGGTGPPEPDRAAAGLPLDGLTRCLAAGTGRETLLIT